MGDQAISERQARVWFWGIFAVAVALRVLWFNSYSAHHPDELIQYLEQAHRIVFGYGVVPWEFREFIRSWLIPLMLVPPMLLVFGTTILVTIAGGTMADAKQALKALKRAFTAKVPELP